MLNATRSHKCKHLCDHFPEKLEFSARLNIITIRHSCTQPRKRNPLLGFQLTGCVAIKGSEAGGQRLRMGLGLNLEEEIQGLGTCKGVDVRLHAFRKFWGGPGNQECPPRIELWGDGLPSQMKIS